MNQISTDRRTFVTGATAAVATTALVVPLVTQNAATPSAAKPLVSNGMQPAAGAPRGAYLKIDPTNVVTVIIGSTEYISVTQPAKSTTPPLTFYSQQTTGAQAVDPAHTYLPYYNKGPATKSGSVTTVTLSQGGQTEHLTYTVTGNYVSNFKAVTPGGTINLAISKLGTSPAVALPKGAKIVAAPTQSAG